MAEERLGASFSIDVSSLKAGLQQANRLIRESESEFKAAAAGMDDWKKSQEGLTAKIKSLNDIAEIQQKKLDALTEEYDRCIADGMDPMSAAAVKMRTDINNQKAALEKTKSEISNYGQALEELNDTSEDTSKSVKGTGEAAKQSAEGFTIAKGAISNLVAEGFKSLIGACTEAISSLAGLAEETREYREDIGKLNTAFQAAGKTTEQAKAIYKDFYSILGEEDRSVEAVNHLAKLTDSQEELTKWTDIAAGVWGTFGDSLPIEGLTESANETSKVAKLTGPLTDAIVWAGIAEDDFNAALESCNSEQERATYITETLNDIYKEAGDLYRQNNKSVIEARKATSEYTDVQADLGEALEPVNTGISQLKTEFIKGLTPALKKEVIPQVKNFLKQLKEKGTVDKFSKSVSELANKGLTGLSKAIQFAAENTEAIIKVVGAATAGFVAYKAAVSIGGIITAVATATQGATTAMAAFNAVLALNPAGAVALGISALTAGLVLLATSEDDAAVSTQTLTDEQLESITASQEAAEAYRESKQATDELVYAQSAQYDYLANSLLPQLKSLVDENGNVKESEKERADFILNELNEAMGTEYNSIKQVIGVNGELRQSVYDVIEAKKAQMLLEAYEETYKEAIQNVSEAEQTRVDTAQDLAGAQDQLAEKDQELIDLQKEYEKALATNNDSAVTYYVGEISRVQEARDEIAKAVDDKKQKYLEAEEAVKGYYLAIDKYESASTASLKGETDKVIGYLSDLGKGYDGAADSANKSKEDQVAALQQQVIDSEVNLALLEEDYKQNQANMTDEEKRQAEARINQAKKEANDARIEYETVGGNMIAGMAAGVEGSTSILEGAIRRAVRAALAAAEDEAEIESPSKLFKRRVGKYMGLGVAAGVEDSTKDVVKSVRNLITEAGSASDMQAISKHISGSTVPAASTGSGKATSVTVYQTNNYAQAHSRLELYKSKQATAAAVRLALGGI